MKLPGHRPRPFDRAHGSELVEELPGNVVSFHIVPLDPAYKAGLTGHVPVTGRPFLNRGDLDNFPILDKDVDQRLCPRKFPSNDHDRLSVELYKIFAGFKIFQFTSFIDN